MKVRIKRWDAVGLWQWNLDPRTDAASGTQPGQKARPLFVTHNLAHTSTTLPVNVRFKLRNSVPPRPDVAAGEPPVPQLVEIGHDEEENDVCGICRNLFDGCCPECSVPGDGCPLSFGTCTHVFHRHCIQKWLAKQEGGGGSGTCPMDRRVWEYAR